MLHTADSLVASDYPDTFELTSLKQGLKPGKNRQEPAWIPLGEANDGSVAGRYGEGRRLNAPAIILTALLHVIALVAVFQIRHEAVPEERSRLMVIDLKPSPPAPAPTAAPPPSAPPPSAKPAVAAPTPRIQVSSAVPVITTTPDPAPQLSPAAVSAPPGPTAAPVEPGTVQSGDLGTRMISGNPPRYPTESRRQREQGTVVLALTLDVDGRVEAISVTRSSGHPRLDDAALRAVRKWRWAPTLRGGQPVMVRGQVEIPFVLQG